jgi:hypothetical protein
MRNGLCLGVIAALILSARSVDAQVSYFYRGPAPAYSVLLRAAFGALLSRPVFFAPQTDGGGGDGGGGDGGGGDGGSDGGGDGSSGDGSSSDGTGDSADGGDAAAAAAAAAAADAASAQDAPAVSDPTTDPTTTDAISVNPEESPLDAIQAIPTTDPRGGEEPTSGLSNGGVVGGVVAEPGGSVSPTGGAPSVPVDVEIDAVIVSGANSPWGAVQRAPGVRNITVVGGIIALGKTPLPGEPPPGSPQPAWLRVLPDLRLLNGSVIPPVVPNIIDIRWLNCPIEVIENPAD